MGAPKLETKLHDIKNPTKVFDKYYTEELIIGLCGQLGTDLKLVSKDLKDILEVEYGYECEEIKLSEFLFEGKPKTKDEYDRILNGMNYGDQIRHDYNNEFLASRAISKISATRILETRSGDLQDRNFTSRRRCFIVNSIKHPDEVIAFQKVYESSFYLIGVFSSEADRKQHLEDIIPQKYHSEINNLIVRDNDDVDVENGQKLRDVFTKSDYFIRFSKESLKNKINKFIDLIFDFGVNTPSKDENAMFQATAAAVNSACLSRQVGACITDKNGEILSTGWNDVPKFGGGVYLHTDGNNDQRCFCENWKCCTNSNKKESMIQNIVSDLTSGGLITSTTISEIENILKRNGIKDLIEFGRSVHAEMNAIIIGSQQTGDRMRGGNLFCTTFPCHNCARHIIMSGIKKVYYIEPYPKSLCLDLHKDAITENEEESDKVQLLMYEGVAPKSFIKFYQLISDDRKIKVSKPQIKKEIKPKHKVHLEALDEKEAHYLKYVDKMGLIQE